MTIYSFDTCAALLQSGKEQFLEHGFEKASLRTICANAGVTTGSFYSHFKQKEDLFTAIVEDDLAAYNATYDGLMDRIVGRAMRDDDGETMIMDFIMDHRDLFRLLFDCSEGTKYAGFRDNLLAKFDDTYQRFFDSYADEPIDSDLVRTIVRMKFTQYCEMLYGDYDKEKVMRITERLSVFTRAGFEKLVQAHSCTDPGSILNLSDM